MTVGKKRREYPSAAKAHIDKLLDEALDETFPASDPVAINMERRAEHRVARGLVSALPRADGHDGD